MSLWSYLWPWSRERQERAERAKQVEKRFQAQLKEAEKRQFNLQAAVETIREDRERRETESQRRPSMDPVLQE